MTKNYHKNVNLVLWRGFPAYKRCCYFSPNNLRSLLRKLADSSVQILRIFYIKISETWVLGVFVFFLNLLFLHRCIGKRRAAWTTILCQMVVPTSTTTWKIFNG